MGDIASAAELTGRSVTGANEKCLVLFVFCEVLVMTFFTFRLSV